MDFKALFSKEEGNPGTRVTVGLPEEEGCPRTRTFLLFLCNVFTRQLG